MALSPAVERYRPQVQILIGTSWGTARFTEGAQTALRCEPLNQEYDPLKGDSLVAATRTEKGLDYVRL